MVQAVSDSELIAKFQTGDTESYVELIGRYTEKVFNLALRLTRNQEDAEEVLQDVFLTVYRKIDRFEGKAAFSSWLYRITVNTAFMTLRRRKQHPTISMEDVNPQIKESWTGPTSANSDVNYISTQHQLREVVEGAIAKLPEEYRAIFLLRDVDGLSNQEVGEILGLSVPAVKSRLHRSRLMLRRRLQRFYDDYVRDDFIYYGPGAAACVKAGPHAS